MPNATIYVDNVSGNNANAGTSEALAVADIATAIGLVSGGGNTIYVQATGTPYAGGFTISGIAGDAIDGPNVMEGYTTTPGARDGMPTITSGTNGQALFAINNASHGWKFRHLKWTHTAATRGVLFTLGGTASQQMGIIDCLIDGVSNAVNTNAAVYLDRCLVQSTINAGIVSNAIRADRCAFVDCGGSGVESFNGAASVFVNDCLFVRCARGVYDKFAGSSSTWRVRGCTAFGCGNGGFVSLAKTASVAMETFYGNVAYGNTGYGIDFGDATNEIQQTLTGNGPNAYGSNSSGNLNNFPASAGDVTLSADPFVNSSASNFASLADAFAAFAPNNTAGGGAALRSVMQNGADLGAVQHTSSGGGGAVFRVIGSPIIRGAL